MSGKTHSFIGIVVALILWIGYIIGKSGAVDIKVLIPIMVGAVAGSLIVDIDTKKSKASQYFTRCVTIFFWGYLIFFVLIYYKIIEIEGYRPIFQFMINHLKNKIGLGFMGILITLGKLSPHRQFTHKWFGTLLFSISAYITFNKFVAVGFIVGYISHILADKLTPAGVKFFEFKLPLEDRKGKFSINF